jgi:HEAT repeat protein
LNAVQARFFGEKPAEEFYDLKADPDEINDLIGAPEHRERIEAMRAALDAHMLKVNDNGFIPESSPVEGFDASRVSGAYPLQRVMQIAGKAITRDPRQVPEFVTLLSDSNEVVRYWAAQGLLILGAKAADAKGALVTCLNKDASHSVRIAAAETLASLGEADRAVQYLGSVIDSQADVRIQLQAVNALTFIGEPAKPLLPLLERAQASAQDEYVRQASRYLVLVLRGTYTPESQIYQGRAARTT